ncbi:MAG: phosphatidylglycerophosphatase A [Arcobacter sp.]|uniref:phosphatidylglycerophosphatase A family protein n=1 Tax=Arcobacter sp. TaxID=1872629 RepID=UPI003AFFE3F2
MRKAFLTLLYSGLSPKAPGTIGSIVALFLGVLLLQYVHESTLFLLSLFITAIAVKQIDIYEKEVGVHDSKEIVIDELAGMWLALSICGINIQDTNNTIILASLAFLFFRLFDIWKPSIIGRIDRDVKGGWGVMGDDLLAGLAAGIAAAGTYQVLVEFVIN